MSKMVEKSIRDDSKKSEQKGDFVLDKDSGEAVEIAFDEWLGKNGLHREK